MPVNVGEAIGDFEFNCVWIELVASRKPNVVGLTPSTVNPDTDVVVLLAAIEVLPRVNGNPPLPVPQAAPASVNSYQLPIFVNWAQCPFVGREADGTPSRIRSVLATLK